MTLSQGGGRPGWRPSPQPSPGPSHRSSGRSRPLLDPEPSAQQAGSPGPGPCPREGHAELSGSPVRQGGRGPAPRPPRVMGARETYGLGCLPQVLGAVRVPVVLGQVSRRVAVFVPQGGVHVVGDERLAALWGRARVTLEPAAAPAGPEPRRPWRPTPQGARASGRPGVRAGSSRGPRAVRRRPGGTLPGSEPHRTLQPRSRARTTEPAAMSTAPSEERSRVQSDNLTAAGTCERRLVAEGEGGGHAGGIDRQGGGPTSGEAGGSHSSAPWSP